MIRTLTHVFLRRSRLDTSKLSINLKISRKRLEKQQRCFWANASVKMEDELLS